jgi:hypothetical protein
MAQAAPSKHSIDPSDPNWSLYPSPASDRLYIQSNFDLRGTEISIYSLSGAKVYHGLADSNPISLSRYADGMYMAILRASDQILGKKAFVIEKSTK